MYLPSQHIIQNSGLLQSRTLADFINHNSDQPLPSPNFFQSSVTLPTIDLHAAGPDHQVVAACRDWGFFQVQNHGVPLELLNTLRRHSHTFFELPLAQKERAAAGPATNFYGYGVAKARTYFPNAWMEAFDMEWTPVPHVREHVGRLVLPQSQADEFCGVVEDYATKVEKLAVHLTELVALGLGLDATAFSRHFQESTASTVRMNYYPPCPQPSVTLGILPHSDFNVFTILLQDTVPGLQLLKDDEWITVEPSQDALLVNVGDTFQAWSNERIKSVKHRALVNKDVPRLSVVYFFGPHPDTVIASPKELIDSEYPLRYRAFAYRQMVEQLINNGGKIAFESPLQPLLL